MATDELNLKEKQHFKNYFASGAINIETIEHVENLFPGSPEMVEKFLKKKSKTELIDEKLNEFINSLKLQEKDGKDLLAPYIAAFIMGYAPKMDYIEFNKKYGTSLSKTTFNNWTSPVFYETKNEKYNYKETELRFYKNVFNDIIESN